jgi:hypothetical protein
MKLRICAMGAMASAFALWACSTSLPGVGTGGVDGGGGGGGLPGQDGGGTQPSAEGGTSTAGLVFLPDPEGFCSRVVGCEQDAGPADGGSTLTQEDCLVAFQSGKFTPACVDQLNASSCADIVGSFPAKAACFPSCSTDSAVCNGDGTITVCNQGENVILDCARACTAAKLTWSGACAKTFNGQTSKTGKDQCWCQ